jgi:EKC/KEOPS complex subunit CGI121/TPRKB
MINLRTYELEHIPEPHQVHIAHFKDVKNASFLQEQLLAGNQDFEYAFVDAGAVSSLFLSLDNRISRG